MSASLRGPEARRDLRGTRTITPDEREFYRAVGRRVAEARQRHGLKQLDLALQLNVGQAALSNVECGNVRLNLIDAVKICHVLNVDLNWLILGEPTKAKRRVSPGGADRP